MEKYGNAYLDLAGYQEIANNLKDYRQPDVIW